MLDCFFDSRGSSSISQFTVASWYVVLDTPIVATGGYKVPVVATRGFLDPPGRCYRRILSSCSYYWKIFTVVGHLLIGHLRPPIFGQLLPPILGQLLPLILGQLLPLILGHLLPLFIKRESTSTTCPTTHPTSSRRPWTRPPSSIKPLGLCNDRIYLDTFKCMSVWNVA